MLQGSASMKRCSAS